jgi:uncharacterized protein (TIGR03000 family)
MRHRWYATITLALATLAVLAWSAGPTFARDGRGGRGWGGDGGWNGGWGWGGNGWYGGRGWGNGYGWGGWYGDGYGWRGNWGYPYSSYGYYQPNYTWYQPYTYGYYDQPDYANYYGYNPTDQGYTSFYSGPTEDQNAARISVVVPPNAQVFFDGEKTTQRGQFRRFVSPALDPGQTFTYDIKAVWDENGKKVERERKVHVRAGQQSSVDFLAMGRGGMEGTEYNRNDMNRTDTERNRDLNRDRTDMNRMDRNRNRTDTTNDRNRTEPAPAPEPKDQNKPPAF